ncbi:hypothetical protein [Desulfosarcina ovata]|uniref:Uncharacterized protein n=1 Tax=Desulfosarcina ovata subsp. ovata TaxID=2752305 RepID=A0A5K8AB21_9BACT|nr:hypothetical protein [Desulfosarcina ovata]BBO89688.1 hypothetical protein DSCOOX_28680 [Desulfosarcina ovata subsp. ovata]
MMIFAIKLSIAEYSKKLIYISLIIFLLSADSSFSYDYCIILKNGKIILADDHWEEDGKKIIEIDGKEITLGKYAIEKIIDPEKHEYSNNTNDDSKYNSDLYSYESDGGILYLNDNRKYTVRKSWVEGSNIAFLIKNKIIYFSPNKIRSFKCNENGLKSTNVEDTYYGSMKDETFNNSANKSKKSNSSYVQNMQIKKLESQIERQKNKMHNAMNHSDYCNSEVQKYHSLSYSSSSESMRAKYESYRVIWMERDRSAKARFAREQIELNKLEKELYLLKKRNQ